MKGQGTSIVNVKPGPAFLLALVLTLAPSLPVPERAQAIRLIHPAVEDRVDGNRLLTFEMGQPGRSAQIARQKMGEKAFPADGALRLLDEWEGEFVARGNDSDHLSVMDPTLIWNTFIGSESIDVGNAIALDGTGNVYVAGYSESTWDTPVNPYTGSSDTIVAKFDSSGRLQWNTFLGSTDVDQGYAIAVSGDGEVYVAGSSPTSWGLPINPYAGNGDAFVAKLDDNGILQWHTFLGSASLDEGYAVTTDRFGSAYVAGGSYAAWGNPVNPYAGVWDAFVAKIGVFVSYLPIILKDY